MRWTRSRKATTCTICFPKEGIGTAAEGIALLKGAKNPELRQEADRLGDVARHADRSSAKYKINFVPGASRGAVDPSLAAVLKGAKIFPIDDSYAGANRKRIVERWVPKIANAS